MWSTIDFNGVSVASGDIDFIIAMGESVDTGTPSDGTVAASKAVVVDANKDYKIETVNISVILDNFTDENGTLEILSQLTNNWVSVYPKKGDIVAIRGNTLHRSGENKSSESRGLFACVYTEKKIEQIHNDHIIKDFVGLEKIISKYLNDWSQSYYCFS